MTARRKKRATSKQRKVKASGSRSVREADNARQTRKKTKTRPAVSPKKSRALFAQRSEAAKKGWKTRRKNLRAKKRLLSDTTLRRQVRQDVKKRLQITESRDVPRWATQPPDEWLDVVEDEFMLDAHDAYTLWYSP